MPQALEYLRNLFASKAEKAPVEESIFDSRLQQIGAAEHALSPRASLFRNSPEH